MIFLNVGSLALDKISVEDRMTHQKLTVGEGQTLPHHLQSGYIRILQPRVRHNQT
jgi:hypothetical protein